LLLLFNMAQSPKLGAQINYGRPEQVVKLMYFRKYGIFMAWHTPYLALPPLPHRHFNGQDLGHYSKTWRPLAQSNLRH
jgi:hypothetical protein